MLMLIDTGKMKILKVVESEAQAYYWADILLPKSDHYVNDFSLTGLSNFTVKELTTLYVNSSGREAPISCVTDELLCGLLLNLETNLIDHTNIAQLYATLGREPLPLTPLPSKDTKTPAQPRTSGGTRSSGVKDIIFEVADRVWSDAGKPTDLKDVRNLRKIMMDLLEVDGVKRTTSSSTLGAWQKERLPS